MQKQARKVKKGELIKMPEPAGWVTVLSNKKEHDSPTPARRIIGETATGEECRWVGEDDHPIDTRID